MPLQSQLAMKLTLNNSDITTMAGTSVVAALAGFFAIFLNKLFKIVTIFEQLDPLKSQFVLCQN